MKCFQLFVIVFALSCATLIGCEKEGESPAETPVNNDTTPINDTIPSGDEVTLNTFVGTYSLETETDSLAVDGVWMTREYYCEMTGKSEPTRYGTLVITLSEQPNTVNIIGQLNGSDYYVTTATLNANKELVVEPSTLEAEAGPMHFTYANITNGSPIVFRTEMHYNFMGMDCGYIYTNTCTTTK